MAMRLTPARRALLGLLVAKGGEMSGYDMSPAQRATASRMTDVAFWMVKGRPPGLVYWKALPHRGNSKGDPWILAITSAGRAALAMENESD